MECLRPTLGDCVVPQDVSTGAAEVGLLFGLLILGDDPTDDEAAVDASEKSRLHEALGDAGLVGGLAGCGTSSVESCCSRPPMFVRLA